MRPYAFAAVLAAGSLSQTAIAQTDAGDWHRVVAGLGIGAGSRSIGNETNGHFIKAFSADVGLRLTDDFGINYEFRQGLLTASEQMRFHLATLDWHPLFDRGAPNLRIGASAGTGSVHAHPFVDGFHTQDIRGNVPVASLGLAMDRYGEALTFSPFVNILRTFGNLSSHTCMKNVDANGSPILTGCVDDRAKGIALMYLGVALGVR
jgi:hypothetical protein